MGSELRSGYDCPVCGEHHVPLPLSFSAKAPDAISAIPAAERATRIVISPDQCAIDERRFFLRGRILVPVAEVPEPFLWGVWAEVSLKDFYRTNQDWTTKGREATAPFPGRLATAIPFYPETLDLSLAVHTQPVGRRPHFMVTHQTHPLAVEQSGGVPLRRVVEIAAAVQHGTVPHGSSRRT